MAVSSFSPRRTIGLIVGGVGIAGLGAGGAFAYLAKQQLDGILAKCPSYPHCPTTLDPTTTRRDHDVGKTDATVATIAVAAGATALVMGALIFFTAPRRSAALPLPMPLIGSTTGGVMISRW